MSEASIRVVSTITIHLPERVERSRWELTVWDVPVLSIHYIQKGLLFPNPPTPLDAVIQRLQTSLSNCLLHFYPLSGRLATDSEITTFIDCDDSGAQFIVAEADGVYVSDLVNSADIPSIVKSFFPLDGAINYDGYSLPLLAVQVTKLVDGVFIGCSFNHVVGDGESFWHFFNSWSELSSGRQTLSRPPLTERPQIHKELGPIYYLPSRDDMEWFKPPLLRERIFHFTVQDVQWMKTRANKQSKPENGEISSLQALIALMWRSITRARDLPSDQITCCMLAAGVRNRLDPPLPRDYLGNYVQPIWTKATLGELLSHELGWAARALHETVVGHTYSTIRKSTEQWVKNPSVHHLSKFDQSSVVVGSSPRFDVFGSDFGWGKGLAVLSGSANKADGKMAVFPGKGGNGDIDFHVCLLPHVMSALELDEELLDALAHI